MTDRRKNQNFWKKKKEENFPTLTDYFSNCFHDKFMKHKMGDYL